MNDCKYSTRSSQVTRMCKSTALWSNQSSDSLKSCLSEGKQMWRRIAILLRRQCGMHINMNGFWGTLSFHKQM